MRYVIQVHGVDQWGRRGWIGLPNSSTHDQARGDAEVQRLRNVTPGRQFRLLPVGAGETGEFSLA